MALEDGEWQKANDFFEQALNLDPARAEAYLGIAMGKEKVHNREEYAEKFVSPHYEPDKIFARARQFAQGELKDWLENIDAQREKNCAEEKERLEKEREERIIRLNGIRGKIRPASALIRAGSWYTVGLKSDGTVVAVGSNSLGQCDVEGWTDIVAVSAGARHTVGLKSDGTVVATKYIGDSKYYHGQCDVKGWKLFNSLDTLEEERRDANRRAEQARQQRLAALAAEETRLQNELSSLRGLFTGKRRREIEQRLDDIRTEKMNLTKR